MHNRMNRWLLTLVLLMLAGTAAARTRNGNVFALYYSEARNDRERAELLQEHVGNPHYFRYLQIMSMERDEAGRVFITAFEPSSYLDVKFVVTKSVSRDTLLQDPESKVGDAIAITGVVRAVEEEQDGGQIKRTIVCSPVIVRHKDRLDPKRGKEYLYEVDSSARFYSYTGGDQPVALSYRDRDLLQSKSRILAQGKQAWTDFLLREVAEREKARAAERQARIAKERELRARAKEGQEAEAAKGLDEKETAE